MDTLDWDKLKTFHAAAESGSLTAAAELLRISQSAVSRQITALEDSLDTPLFHRHARGLTLTEQGRILYNTAHDMAHKVALAQASVIDSRNKPQGTLRVSTPISKYGAPSSAEDLDNHKIVAFGELNPNRLHSANWVLKSGRTGPPRDQRRVV